MKSTVAFLIVVVSVNAVWAEDTLIMPLIEGQTWIYERTDSLGNSWTVTLEVIEKVSFGDHQYFRTIQYNYRPGETKEIIVRSTDEAIYVWTGESDEMVFVAGPIGLTIPFPLEGDLHELYDVNSVTVPYGGPYTAYVYRNQNVVEQSPFWYEYIVPGLGIVQEVDYWADNAPRILTLMEIITPTEYCGDAMHPYPIGDMNEDCTVDFRDFAIMASHWLEDNNP